MANYFQRCRTNYFRVKDVDEFITDLRRYGIDVSTKLDRYGINDDEIVVERHQGPTLPNKPEGSVALFLDTVPVFDSDQIFERLYQSDSPILLDAGFVIEGDGPYRADMPDDDVFFKGIGIKDPAGDLLHLISQHLVPFDNAVLMVIGYERYSVLNGTASVVDHTGKIETVDLGDIYDIADNLMAGTTTTGCED